MNHDPFAQVYDELRRLASAKLQREAPGHTLNATALVHELYLKIGPQAFDSKSGFFKAAAVAMRRILVDHARARKAQKRGGPAQRIELSESALVHLPDPDTLLAVDEAIDTLSGEDPSLAELARLRLYAGLSVEEAADTLGISRATAFRDWAYARAKLTVALKS